MDILIIHASAGAGHKKAAEALTSRIKETTPWNAVCVDALDLTHPIIKNLYQQTYVNMVTKIPWAWGFIFSILDFPCLQGLIRFGRRCYNRLNFYGVEKYLVEKNFDWIVCTQFLSEEVAASLKRRGKIKSKILCIVTDFDVHRIWISPGVDFYAGASEFSRNKLLQLGVAPEHAFETGIPTDKKFSKVFDRPALRKQLGLDEKMFTVLIATGSFGSGPIEELIDQLKDYQLIVVCGHNQTLFKHLSQKPLVHVKVCGLVNNMDELMSAADAMITKPGGLSISEALVKNLPMIFFSAIPGQETNNVQVLRRYDISSGLCDSLSDIVQAVKSLSASPQTLSDAREKSKQLAKPSAVDEIIRIIQTH